MNPEVKQEWIKILVDPESQQAIGRLKERDTEARCCLGHLCELFRTKTGIGHWDNAGWFIISDNNKNNGTLPDAVVSWSGLKDHNPLVKFKGREQSIAEVNDSKTPFTEIAKIIEEQL